MKEEESNSDKVIKSYTDKKENIFDPFGSYTGVCEDNEKPVQDSDDL
jgi:hypothetical protein